MVQRLLPCCSASNNRVFPSTSECAICCNTLLPCQACPLPCKSCYDVEKGFSDKLVCSSCASKCCTSNKCPFCNMPMIPVESSAIVLAGGGDDAVAVTCCERWECRCACQVKCDMGHLLYDHGCKVACMTVVMSVMMAFVTILVTVGVCSRREEVCVPCYAFCPFFVLWVWFMIAKLSCDIRINDNTNFCVGVCTAIAFTLFLSFSYENNCSFNWDMLALFLITCPCCAYCSTRTHLPDD